jgi:tetratricopeptide (TPR) repeat protein
MLKTAPKSFYSLHNRGNAYLKLHDYKNAIADYTKAVSNSNAGIQGPESLYIKNTLARVLATCPEKSLRDGVQAAKIANSLVSASKNNFTSPHGIIALTWFNDTLAAAYAESRRFDEAVETMKQAISLIKASQISRLRALPNG